MIGNKRRLFTNAVVKARVLARKAIEKHKLDFMSQLEMIQIMKEAMRKEQNVPGTELPVQPKRNQIYK